MALITLDFETPYEGKKPPKVERSKFSLRTRTYEEYILDSELFCDTARRRIRQTYPGRINRPVPSG